MSDGSIKDFEDALYLLDEELQKTNHSCIVIKAIGGFAMLYHGLQDHGYTIDIDSLTTDFDDEVKYLISLVGNKNNLDSDWINTDCTMLEGMLNDLAPNIVWEKAIYDFKKIELYVADINGLLRAKLKAIHDGGLVPRITDKKDVILILKLLDISCINEIDANSEMKYIKDDYSRAYDYLASLKKW